MASSDYNVADRKPETGSFPVTAGAKVNVTAASNPDVDAAAYAATNNVSNAAYVGYAAALATYEARADIETLADRRARTQATTDSAQDFMRRAVYNADGSVKSPPRPGSVKGNADKSA